MGAFNRSYSWPQNPIAQVLSMLAFFAFAVVAVFVGAVLVSFFFGIAAIAALVFYARLWWLRHKGRRSGGPSATGEGRIIEAQYEVVRRRDDEPSDKRD